MDPNAADLKTIAKRIFWHYEMEPGDDGCWLWTGPKRKYEGIERGCIVLGSHTPKARRFIAPRVAYLLWVGPIPEGKNICHKCDRTLCIRPEHLFPGTQKQNMEDAAAKGRIKNGWKHGAHRKITDAQIAEIRQRRLAGESGIKIAKEFGLCHTQVYRIALKRRRTKLYDR